MRETDAALATELVDEAAMQDPHPLYERLHEAGDVHPLGSSGFYAVSGWDAVNEAVARVSDFSSNLTATIMRAADGSIGAYEMDPVGGPTHVLATADDPAHAVHRKMLVPRLAAKHIRALEALIRATFDDLWTHTVSDDRLEWMSGLANRLPMLVVGDLIGVPDADIDQLSRWGYAGTQLLEGVLGEAELAAAGSAIWELSEYISGHFERAAAEPGDNLLSDLATACASGDLASTEALLMMITLFSAGGESTASLIGSAVYLLATKPELQRHLREHPDDLTGYLEETLRYEPPFRGHYRHVLTDTTLSGVDLKAGSRLLLLWGAANRDPRYFNCPNEFQIGRPGNTTHLSFGKGAHFCVGAALARLEARIVVGELLRRTKWVDAASVGRWLPSLLVRRLASLELDITPEPRLMPT